MLIGVFWALLMTGASIIGYWILQAVFGLPEGLGEASQGALVGAGIAYSLLSRVLAQKAVLWGALYVLMSTSCSVPTPYKGFMYGTALAMGAIHAMHLFAASASISTAYAAAAASAGEEAEVSLGPHVLFNLSSFAQGLGWGMRDLYLGWMGGLNALHFAMAWTMGKFDYTLETAGATGISFAISAAFDIGLGLGESLSRLSQYALIGVGAVVCLAYSFWLMNTAKVFLGAIDDGYMSSRKRVMGPSDALCSQRGYETPAEDKMSQATGMARSSGDRRRSDMMTQASGATRKQSSDMMTQASGTTRKNSSDMMTQASGMTRAAGKSKKKGKK